MSNYPPPGSTGPTRPMNTQPQNSQPTNQPPYQPNPYQQNPYQQGQPQFSQAPPPKKGGGGLKWVLIGCGGFILIGVIAVAGIFYFARHKMQQAGVDPDLMRRNPALAIAKAAIMHNSDVEFISLDENKNTITVRDKKTGKVVTIDAEKAGDGKIVVKEDGKEIVTMQGGKDGSAEIKTADGNVKVGKTSGTPPDWLPQYPGVDIEGTYAIENAETSGAGFSFTTDDSVEEVVEFYEDKLKSEGFKITKTTSSTNGQSYSSVIANEASNKRNVVINISTVDGDTKVQVISQTKK